MGDTTRRRTSEKPPRKLRAELARDAADDEEAGVAGAGDAGTRRASKEARCADARGGPMASRAGGRWRGTVIHASWLV